MALASLIISLPWVRIAHDNGRVAWEGLPQSAFDEHPDIAQQVTSPRASTVPKKGDCR
jgi:hypothetical protein